MYADDHVRIAGEVGKQIAGAIANGQLFAEREKTERTAQRVAEERAVLAEIGRIISSSLDINEIYERFADRVRTLIPFDRLAISILDIEDSVGSTAYEYGLQDAGESTWDLAGTLTGEVVHSQLPVSFTCIDENEMSHLYPGELASFRSGIRSSISVPLLSREEVIASLYFKSTTPDAFSDDHVRIATEVSRQIAGAIANAQLFAEREKTERKAQRVAEERAVLAEIGRIISSSIDIDEI